MFRGLCNNVALKKSALIRSKVCKQYGKYFLRREVLLLRIVLKNIEQNVCSGSALSFSRHILKISYPLADQIAEEQNIKFV